VAEPDEFRLVLPQIYNLGRSFQQSILRISKKRRYYEVELVQKTDKSYGKILGWCTEKCPKGRASVAKVWGYV